MNSPAAAPQTRPALQLWGGVECTVNRVGDLYFDQIARSRHHLRQSDLDRIAQLGIRTVRYPALWEWAAPARPGMWDWAWADERLPALRSRGLTPIVGLLHHGSGPRYTSLLDPGFALGLAQYAGALAARFPWVEHYTPINEPLTTARFSALYGHWYPHEQCPRQFLLALLNQCKATVLAMRAIRRVRPDAKLVQTEDLGKTHSTPALGYQADFENCRRWLTFDLLCGRVDRQHPLADYFRSVGVPEHEWRWFEEFFCPPDVLGVNHYLTSERYLDDRLDQYPPHTHGGNGRHRYADVEAVRVVDELAGPARLLQETWQRYRRPLAVTEAHLGCTREEQLRWLHEVWRSAQQAREQGADVRAVTIWSLFGAYDWDSLVTRAQGHYEPGAFDLRGSPSPRPTALAAMAQTLAAGREPAHPVLATPGWWHRPQRFAQPARREETHGPAGISLSRPVLILGSGDVLSGAFSRVCSSRGLDHHTITPEQVRFTCVTTIEERLRTIKPWAVIHTASFPGVNAAEAEPELCRRDNLLVPATLAELCERLGISLLTFSSDLVFDGALRSPYRESDRTEPLCVYGLTKAEAESQVLTRHPRALVVRSGAYFCPWDQRHFLAQARRALRLGQPIAAAEDLCVSPTYVPDLVHACLDLLVDGEQGIWHLANRGAVTWADLARDVARREGHGDAAVCARPAHAFGWAARRPAYSALGSERANLLPPLNEALDRYFHAAQVMV